MQFILRLSVFNFFFFPYKISSGNVVWQKEKKTGIETNQELVSIDDNNVNTLMKKICCSKLFCSKPNRCSVAQVLDLYDNTFAMQDSRCLKPAVQNRWSLTDNIVRVVGFMCFLLGNSSPMRPRTVFSISQRLNILIPHIPIRKSIDIHTEYH